MAATDKRSTQLSSPRVPRWARLLMYALLLGLAFGAIWWIDRGAMFTNSR